MTALHYACKYGHHKIVQLLIKEKANVEIEDFVSLEILYNNPSTIIYSIFLYYAWLHVDTYVCFQHFGVEINSVYMALTSIYLFWVSDICIHFTSYKI